MPGRIEFHELLFRFCGECAGPGRVDILPEVLHGVCRDDRMADLGIQQLIQQGLIAYAVLLVQPKRLQQMVGFGFIIRIKVLHPAHGFLNHGV